MREPGHSIATILAERVNTAPKLADWVPGESLQEIPYTLEVAKLEYLPKYSLADLAKARTVFVSVSRSRRLAGREPRRIEVTIGCMVVAKLDKQRSQLTTMIDYMYSIEELISAQSDLGFTGSTNVETYDHAALDEQQVFRSVLQCTFANQS